jgi:hemerythrin
MAIEWNDDLLVGNHVIDRQHREIFRKYGEFLNACKNGKGRDALLEILDYMGAYAEQHFALEERLMAEKNYPDRHGHMDEHRELRALVSSLRTQAAEQGPTLSILADTNRKLLDWLIDHIRKSDKALAGFLNQQWGLL